MDNPLNWMKVSDSMISRLKEAAAIIESTEGPIRVISHHDGDGISSAGIITLSLYRAGKDFHTTLMGVMSQDDIEVLDSGYNLFILADMGSSMAPLLSDRVLDLGARCMILDHHMIDRRDVPYSISDGRGIIEINPRFHGVNGTSGCSGSTLSFLLSLAMDPGNSDLSIFSLAGSIADRQNVPYFTELNEGVRRLAVELGLVESRSAMPLSGRNIEESLHISNDPFVRGLSGHSQRVSELLNELGIDPGTGMDDLDPEIRKSLQSYLYVHLLKQGVSSAAVNELFREIPISREWGSLLDLAYEIDCCGRMNETGVGVEVVWGGKEARRRAREYRIRYRQDIQSVLLKLEKEGPNEMDNLHWIEVAEESHAGTVAGISQNYLFDPSRPVLSISGDDEGVMKVSGRGNRSLVSSGLDLGAVLRKACGNAGGSGGGHDVAAGGKLTGKNLHSFLEECDRLIGEQLEG